MKQAHRIFWVLFILIAATIISWFPLAYAEDSQVIVGVYECTPYYELDEKGNVSGFYDELLNLLETKCDFTHTYKVGSFEDTLDWLADGTVDIAFGISITADRLDRMLYSEQSIETERFALYSNIGDLAGIKTASNVKAGVVPGSKSAEFLENYFNALGVSVELVEERDWQQLQDLFDKGEIDVIPHSISSNSDPKLKIYEFTGDQVYIAGNQKSREILEQLDNAIVALHSKTPDPIQQLHSRYFDEKESNEFNRLVAVIAICLLIAGIGFSIPTLRRRKIKKQIKKNMQQGYYLLQYQPIYNPLKKCVTGYEALLRLKSDKKMIPPAQFIPDIEKNGMLREVSLWILKKVIQDYDTIKSYSFMENQKFYLSINTSLNEIESKSFTRKACELLKQSNLGPNKICLEIIERIKMEDLANAKQNLQELKEAGFKIAIDDFGTEYSNFDLLLKLDIDVVKVDRSLVTDIDKDSLKKEVVKFISQIARLRGKDVVLEGVELESEVNTIKEFNNERVCVQGYYYSKPLFRDDLEMLKIQ